MPFGLQPLHLIVVAVVALLIFGPAKLPELGRSIGKTLTEFRKGAKEMTGSFMEEVNQPSDGPSSQPLNQTIAPPSTAAQPILSQQFAPAPETSQIIAPIGSNVSGYAHAVEEKPAAQVNFCIHCGKSNPNGAVFCNSCGSKITA